MSMGKYKVRRNISIRYLNDNNLILKRKKKKFDTTCGPVLNKTV